MNIETTAAGPSTEGPAAPCTRCQSAPRKRRNTSYCAQCLREMSAAYRDRTRPRERFEDRICALEGCNQTFIWRSTHAKQLYCSKSHYGIARYRAKNPETQIPEGTKRCNACKSILQAIEFTPSELSKKSGACRSCVADRMRAYKERHGDRVRETQRRARARRLLREYGAPTDSIDELIVAQDGRCACCKEPFPVERLSRGCHIDHDHKTGKYRALLCQGCNVGLGAFQEDPARLQAAIEYLSRF